MSSPLTVHADTPFHPVELEQRSDLGSIDDVALQLAVKTASNAAHFTTQWMMEQLKLPHRIVDDILWELKEDKLVEMVSQIGPLSYQYRITNAGLDFSKRLMALSGYVGPTPVSLSEYTESVKSQRSGKQRVGLEDVKRVTGELTLPPKVLETATLAVASNRSLFIFGPPGNGKSSLGHMLHRAVEWPIWIPYAVAVDNQVVRLYDPQYHQPLADTGDSNHDPRWIQIRRPFVIAGGELTMDQLDLAYDRSVNFYEAPPHLKANCGTFFIDDLGRQRIPPFDLLNRWIIPLEQNVDYLSFINGKKIEVPFEMMLIVATNLETSDVSDAAFLRRMGYRIHLNAPSELAFRTILENQANRQGLSLAPELLEAVVQRYRDEGREWRASEARDLLVRCRDVIDLREVEPFVDGSVLEAAWRGFFGSA